MKILQVRFKNLNSLAGEWEVDLTDPAFASDGIFVITGPTGAGKTTILDAVCLALYGRTPRLPKVTKSGNEILSRRTGECCAEVTFETQAGRYRCHWSQRRARKRPDGELQAPKHEIADADSGTILESNIRGVAERIESVTGMDFDRFTRSMLLAQGGFAAFLQAAPDDRAPILEQITGTEIYSRISIRVHERQRAEREKLDRLQAETAGIAILGPEEEEELRRALETRQGEEADLAARSAEVGRAMAWLTAIDGLKEELVGLAGEESELGSALEAFEPEREKLGRATRAASLDGAYATLAAARKQQAADEAALKLEEETLPGLESSAGEASRALESAEREAARAKEALRAAAPTLQRVRALDQQLADRARAIAESVADCARDAARIDADRRAVLREREGRAEAAAALEGAGAYLREHACDEWLVGGLAGVEEQFSGLLSVQKEIVRREAGRDAAAEALELAGRSLDDRRRGTEVRRRELVEAAERIREARESLGRLLGDRLLREYRTEKDSLLREAALQARIAELEAHRASLVDGEPCPLCGATQHPFAKGNAPVPDAMERRIEELSHLIDRAEGQEARIAELEAAEGLARQNLAEAERLEAVADHGRGAAEKALDEAKGGLERLLADFSERRRVAAERLLPLGVSELPESGLTSVIESLGARLRAWQDQVGKRSEAERRIAGIDGEVKRLEAVIETQSAALAERRERLEALKGELAAGSEERRALYGDGSPDEEERLLHEGASRAEEAEKQARERHDALRQQWNNARARVEALRRRIGQRGSELERLEAGFAAALAPLDFADEGAFLASVLSPGRRAELTARARELDDRRTDLRARRRDREARLAAELEKKVTDEPLGELETRFEAYQEALRGLREVLAGLGHRLAENAAARERVRERRTALEAQREECRRWDDLHELIGSADGKKYRNFAQGLTFDLVVGHANRQLRRMSDRYLLVRDDAQPLELNVIDDYQAGEVRSTKNLSGGESFIVSLALALGLSRMASRNVRVDSLFLDEGFGTLDEDALDTALEALATLRRDGKLIGVISHVPALKERIGTQIRVTPQTGGRSRLSGPGCRRVGDG